MVRGHHRLNGHEFVQTLGDSEGQGSLVCPWARNLATEQPHHQGGASSAFAILASDVQCLDFPGLLPNTQKGRKKKPRPRVFKPTLDCCRTG